MTDHLPECPWAHRGYAFPCICDRLRACEQRVFQEQIKVRQHDMVMAYLRGLDAAEAAVVYLRDERRMGGLAPAVAAIRALKEKRLPLLLFVH